MTSRFTMLVTICLAGTAAAANPPLPTADKPGSADSPVLSRIEGALILSHDKKSLDEVSLPLSKLVPVPGKKVGANNDAAEPKKKKVVEGETTRFLYVMPAGKSSLEVFRSYGEQIKASKGKILYECKAPACGGKPNGNSLDGGSSASLPMYLRGPDEIKEEPWSVPWCAAHVKLTDVRYMAAEIPAAGAHVSVLTAATADVGDACGALAGRTLALVDVIQAKRGGGKP